MYGNPACNTQYLCLWHTPKSDKGSPISSVGLQPFAVLARFYRNRRWNICPTDLIDIHHIEFHRHRWAWDILSGNCIKHFGQKGILFFRLYYKEAAPRLKPQDLQQGIGFKAQDLEGYFISLNMTSNNWEIISLII
jgi:hypothetical protein